MSAKALPGEITSYDLLKTFAVIVMVIDHLGYYFFYEEPMWRAVGRTGFPVWFFLVGYSTGRGIPARLVASACILLATSPLLGLALLPLNALFTIMAIRLVLDPLMRFALKNLAMLLLIAAALAALALPSFALTEYGTLGLVTAMFGYFVRQGESLREGRWVAGAMLVSLLSYVIYEQIGYEFALPEFAVMALGASAVWTVLLHFTAKSYPGLTARLPRAATAIIQFCGRRTLEIYVVHLVAFGVLALLLGKPGMGWFQWRIGIPALGL